MECPKCGAPVNPGQKFCTKCGTQMNAASQQTVMSTANVCPSCGAPLNPGQKFCTKCGTKVDAATQQPAQKSAQGDKGFWDNITHPGTFFRQGSQGVDRQVRREQEARLQQQAQAMGLEVNKPPRNGQNPQQQSQTNDQQTTQPQSRRLTVDTTSVEGVNLVSGRAIWDIKKGEVGRLITETEFANAEGLKGVIVQEGCTAMVFIDGQFITMMQAGVYTFPAKTEAERRLEQRQREMDAEKNELEKQRRALEEEQRRKDEEYANSFAARGVVGEVGAFFRGVGNFLFGKKKNETPEQHRQRVERINQKIKTVPSPKICRVYIVSNRIINLIFGSQETAEGVIDFAPMTIPTKLVDVNVAVSMQLEISNMQEFVKNYLADRKSVSILDFQQMLMPGVKATLQQMLRNFDYQQEGLPEPIVNNLKGTLQMTCEERLQGIRVVRVLDITDSSADFERFRAVERELYASEKELGFLQRTNEFRNRLEQEQNRRVIDEAVNVEQLRQALQQVNKDKLLSEDEMEQFVLLLESQKRIRKANLQKDEAAAMEEVRQALIDIKKSGLVKDDELAALEHQLLQGRMDRDDVTAAHENEIEQRRIDRENVTQIMRIQAAQKAAMAQQIADFELSDSKMEHDMANALRQAQHQGNLAAVQLDNKRLMDAYNDERNEFDWNRAFTRRQQEDDYEWQKEQRKHEADLHNRIQIEDYEYEKAKREQDLREQGAQAAHIRGRIDKFDDIDILERKGNISMRNMMAMKEKELEELEKMNRSAEAIHQMNTNVELNRDNIEANMTAEQLMAKRAAQLDAGAQAAFANALGSGNKVKAEMLEQQNAQQAKNHEEMAALYQQMLQNQQNQGAQNQDFMLQMAQMMQSGMLGAAGAQMAGMQQNFQQQQQFQQQQFAQQQAFQQQRLDDQMQMKQEYQQQAQYAQQRQDHAQDQAFGAMGGVAGAAASNLGAFNGGFNGSAQQTVAMQQPAQPHSTRYCPACGAEVPEGEMFCGECGQKM